jgi:acetoin utilization protein AcuB
MKQELVKDWMVRNVVTVTPDTTFPEAQRLMIEHKIRRLPVVESGRLVGMVTRGDMRGADLSKVTFLSTWELGDMLAKIKVGQIMTPKPVTISQEATMAEAAKVMLERKISGLPAVNSSGQVVGIITESDIFRIMVREWHEM